MEKYAYTVMIFAIIFATDFNMSITLPAKYHVPYLTKHAKF